MVEPAPSAPPSAPPSRSHPGAVARATGISAASGSPAPPSTIGGYRVVRRLGGGATATVLLARGAGRSVALRCYREGVPDARIDAEIESLSRLRSRHLAALHDLATRPDGRIVPVLDAVIGPSLADLLAARRGALDPGEAVTVLVPLAELVHELHEVGVVVGGWSPAGFRIGADGAPVLTALSGLVAAPPLPERFRRQEPGVLADLAGLRLVGEQVVGAVRPDRQDALLEALARVDDPLLLERALFDAARPAPLVLDLSASERSGSMPPSARPSVGADAPPPGTGSHEPTMAAAIGLRGAILRVLDDLGLPSGVIEPLRPDPARARRSSSRSASRRRVGAGARIRAAGTPRLRDRSAARTSPARPRRSVVLVGAAGAIALLGAVALLALEGDESGSASAPASERPEGPASPAPELDGSSTATGAEGEASGTASGADPSVEDGAGTPDGGAAARYADSGADPAPESWPDLVGELAGRWTACRQAVLAGAAAGECAGEVVQPGSAAAEQLAAPSSTAADGLLSAPPSDAVVIDRLGSAALIDLVDPGGMRTASLLVMRSEAGWRIRSVLD